MTDLVTYTQGMVNHYAGLLDERARSGPALGRMQETILGLFQSNDALAKAAQSNQRSLCDAVLSALNLGLSFQPSLGQAYLVPRKGRVCFQLGYRGLMELARRSGGVALMAAELVYPGDRFEVSLGTDRRLVHVPDPWGTGRTYETLLGAYATATLAGGAVDFELMPKAEIERRRAVSMSTSGPWRDWPEEMARKTVLRALLKRLPLSVEAADLLKRDYEDDDPRAPDVPIIESVRPRSTAPRVEHHARVEVQDAEIEEGYHDAEDDGLPAESLPEPVLVMRALAKRLPGGEDALDAQARAEKGGDITWLANLRTIPLDNLPDKATALFSRITEVEAAGGAWADVARLLAEKHKVAAGNSLKRLGFEGQDIDALPAAVVAGLALHLMGVRDTLARRARG